MAKECSTEIRTQRNSNLSSLTFLCFRCPSGGCHAFLPSSMADFVPLQRAHWLVSGTQRFDFTAYLFGKPPQKFVKSCEKQAVVFFHEMSAQNFVTDRETSSFWEWCIFSVSDTGKLKKRKSEFSQQESNTRPSDYLFGCSTTELQEARGS